jgi:hypothetical protein
LKRLIALAVAILVTLTVNQFGMDPAFGGRVFDCEHAFQPVRKLSAANKKVQKNRMKVNRGFNDLRAIYGSDFDKVVRETGPSAVIFDIGTGIGQMIRDWQSKRRSAPRFVAFELGRSDALDSLERDFPENVVVVPRPFEDVTIDEVGKADAQFDTMGSFSYTDNLARDLRKKYETSRPGAPIFIATSTAKDHYEVTKLNGKPADAKVWRSLLNRIGGFRVVSARNFETVTQKATVIVLERVDEPFSEPQIRNEVWEINERGLPFRSFSYRPD